MKVSHFATTLAFLAASAPAFAAATPPVTSSDNIVFPPEAGVFNVKSPEFGAKGDGVADDTAAIQKALTQGLASHRVVYLPNGVYLVSDTLKWQNPVNADNKVQGWGPFLQLQGQSRSKTIIRLQAGAPGFSDAETPKAVIQTGSSGSHGDKTYRNGEGNEAFENNLRNFTVDTGTGNAGAVGIDYQASNQGAMRHVSVKGEGFCGIALTRRDNGPAMIKDVSVEGFDFGLRIGQEIAHFTLEDVSFKNQGTTGIWLRDAIMGARHITSQNTVPAMQVGGLAVLALFDSNFAGGTGATAITTQGTEARIYIRNLKTAGYANSIRSKGKTQPAILTEWSSDAPAGNGGGRLSLNLPIRDTPEWYDADFKNWAIVPPASGDDTKAIQAALDSGRATVFFPFGRYRISETLRVPGTVKRIQGTGTQLNTVGDMVLPDDKPMVQFANGKAGDLTIFDRFEVGAPNSVRIFEHLDARTVVLSSVNNWGGNGFRNISGAGPLFLDDVGMSHFRLAPGTKVWARQWDYEGGQPMVVADGATVWSLGNKHEGADTIFESKNGAKVELWAGFSYSFGVDRNQPAYVADNGSLVVQTGGMTYMGANGFFDLLVKNTQNGQTLEYRRAQAPARNGGAFIPLYVAVAGANPVAANSAAQQPMNIKPLAVAVAATIATGAPAITTPQASTQAVAQVAAKTFKAPEFFDGEENGKPTGNPLEVGGKAMWTAVQIWPDDIFKRENYQPMNWAGDSWHGAYEYGGQPSVKVAGGNIDVTSRGAWGGGGNEPGNKRAALIFIAPSKGTYKVTGIARSFVWEGDKAAGANLTMLKHDKVTGKISRVKQIATPNETEVPIEDATVELNAGDELIFLNAVNAMYTASATALRNLALEYTPATGAATPPATTLKVGAIVEVGGQKYKIVKIAGKQITLEQQ